MGGGGHALRILLAGLWSGVRRDVDPMVCVSGGDGAGESEVEWSGVLERVGGADLEVLVLLLASWRGDASEGDSRTMKPSTTD